ncbi:hypothetical protein [Microcoleus sp. S36b_A4]|uniref:hypothetical protein n=1 Tax=Microcoleus sp. S36b_A4 TaxID=3055420 RepID=UPI002FD0A6D6
MQSLKNLRYQADPGNEKRYTTCAIVLFPFLPFLPQVLDIFNAQTSSLTNGLIVKDIEKLPSNFQSLFSHS